MLGGFGGKSAGFLRQKTLRMLSAMHTSKLTAAVYYSAFSRRIILRGDIKSFSLPHSVIATRAFQNDADQINRNRELTKE